MEIRASMVLERCLFKGHYSMGYLLLSCATCLKISANKMYQTKRFVSSTKVLAKYEGMLVHAKKSSV